MHKIYEVHGLLVELYQYQFASHFHHYDTCVLHKFIAGHEIQILTASVIKWELSYEQQLREALG